MIDSRSPAFLSGQDFRLLGLIYLKTGPLITILEFVMGQIRTADFMETHNSHNSSKKKSARPSRLAASSTRLSCTDEPLVQTCIRPAAAQLAICPSGPQICLPWHQTFIGWHHDRLQQQRMEHGNEDREKDIIMMQRYL